MRNPQAPPRNRPPAGGGGGIWGDSFNTRASSNRPRAGYGVATDTSAGSGLGGRQNLDALRANRLRQQGLAQSEETEGGFTAGKAIAVILLMLVLGAGGAYIYFKISTPAVHAGTSAGSNGTTSSTPSVGPAGTGTPSGFVPHPSLTFTLSEGLNHIIVATGY